MTLGTCRFHGGFQREYLAQKNAISDEQLLAEFQNLLRQKTGLRLTDADWVKAEELLRIDAGRHFPTLATYFNSLSERGRAQELEHIAAQLIPGETFFFRDHGRFDLLHFRLLPALIETRRPQQTLRLWSAGCASGEEAYSLAILIDMMLPERTSWQISIFGSDINEAALAQARRGRYGKWSFRMMPACLQSRYFTQEGDEWLLDEKIRAMVDFRRGNLVNDSLPDWTFRDMDLILCRNVLIYFDAYAIRAVAEKLAACLVDSGYLVTGHTELIGYPVPNLHGRLFPEGVIYQRTSQRTSHLALLSAPSIPGLAPRMAPPLQPGKAAPSGTESGSIQRPPIPPPAPASDIDTAQALADRGDYRAAEAACRKIMRDDPLLPCPHFLLAQLAQLRSEYREAEALLNRTLYLAPDHIAAYLELAALYERAGERERARAGRRAALERLRRLPAETMVSPFETSAGQLADWITVTEAF